MTSRGDSLTLPRRRPARRKYDAEKTKQDILKAATREFARSGFNGARVDTIAARTATSKRMIYYYFGGKEKLYIAVLEREYGRIRAAEADLDLEHLDPETAIRRLTEFTFDFDHANPEFVRLVAIENIHRARHLAKSTRITRLNASIIKTIESILRRGRQEGVFDAELRAVDVHMLMSALCFFHVSNLHTFGTIFQRNFVAPKIRESHKKLVVDFILYRLRKR